MKTQQGKDLGFRVTQVHGERKHGVRCCVMVEVR